MLKIHDIKPIVQIPDVTVFIYYGLIVVAVIFFMFLLYFIFTMLKNKKVSKEKEYFIILSNINFDNSKESSYLISKYGRLLAKTQRDKRLIDDIHNSLENYKYKKNVTDKISDDIKTQFAIFMDSLDVK
ncbi:MAG: hypothetical protein U9R16_07245 [Campylobacterota bacterium]|nr:hypothetical protein [Campylobacterota bacterium]